ncbi:hemerythrin domain-containing protein [Halomonas denitrificans]|uniref:hemerythrin domain-containing protein n=1 Tax=Halomonas TaxID=2745 RepID=UPI001A8DF6C7|nr:MULTISPECIES: hemerythrin domain-containing protein [Halomonas]MED5294962.1 hemerythrin domain-containing protein [Pseudomonadota bacterium]MBN8413187.1 hemerythrin domain-containing protein [Halomonas litopenaei]MBY5924240.1 hemerythrin domain-containing protein [Halomonas sp. DP4Y7-2]MBY5928409.1 hemerythrin domain-containing protein [Halomonas sp. DP8Y7-3]MBY5967058.1 hemerythrin domain-containing protein [Halomonas denitrificans]
MLKQLRRDHANMARILHVLQLKQKTLAQGERPNFQLVREVVDYILDYMAGFTLPLEQICTDRLREVAPASEDIAERLSGDYRKLKARLSRLSRDIDMILMDVAVPMDQFSSDLRDYLDSHRTYLRQEREELFPLISEHFSDEDLERLAHALPEHATSELERLQGAYPELYAELREEPMPA